MTHCRVRSVDRFLEADSGGKIQWIGLSFRCSILGYLPSPAHVENGGVRGWAEAAVGRCVKAW